MIEKFIQTQLSLARKTEGYSFKRYLYASINWRQRLIGIVGPRGAGKTTLMLQYYLENFNTPEDCLYISADNVNTAAAGLFNLAEEFFNLGGKTILIDEVHKYPNWQRELKNIYDSFPLKQVIFSGSSSIHILRGKADLSRRVVYYNLSGLSFREFLIMRDAKSFKPLSFDEILKNHVRIAGSISADFPILRRFKEYLKFGYYPFFNEGLKEFPARLSNVVEHIFYADLQLIYKVRQ